MSRDFFYVEFSAEYNFQDRKEEKSGLQFTNLYLLFEYSDSLDIHVK